MSNRITRMELRPHSLLPSEAEVWALVEAERTTPTTDLRGRLVGPRSLFTSTVEVAYPLRPFARLPAELPPTARRVVIPEPSLWEPKNPFLYEVVLELWQDDQLCDRQRLTSGLRHVQLTPAGFRLNGRPIELRATTRVPTSLDEAFALRQAGSNVVIAPAAATELGPLADRAGLFVLVRLEAPEPVERWARHACFLGGLVPSATPSWASGLQAVLGVELDDVPAELPAKIAFVVGRSEQHVEGKLPRIVLTSS